MRWGVLPSLLPTWLGMYFVVSFGSCLDVAAIQLDMGRRLDFNHELQTVGLSNFLSGLSGGFTGSYIFSLTIFTYRSETNSRLPGITLLIIEGAIFVTSVDLMAYIPRLFFGALLTFIALDLMVDWLWYSRKRLSTGEYVIVWVCFATTNSIGLEGGMGVGFVITLLNFFFNYAKIKKTHWVPSQGSSVVRNFKQRTAITARRSEIVTLKLRGYIFFGSVVSIVEDVERHIILPSADDGLETATSTGVPAPAYAEEGSFPTAGPKEPPKKLSKWFVPMGPINIPASPSKPARRTPSGSPGGGLPVRPSPRSSPLRSANRVDTSGITPLRLDGSARESMALSEESGLIGSTLPNSSACDETSDVEAGQVEGETSQRETKWVILDFSEVNGVDATAARSCFLQLSQLLQDHDIPLLLTCMQPHVYHLLRAHGVIPASEPMEGRTHIDFGGHLRLVSTRSMQDLAAAAGRGGAPTAEPLPASPTMVFSSLDDALEYCEECMLAEVAPSTPAVTRRRRPAASGSDVPVHDNLAEIILQFLEQEDCIHEVNKRDVVALAQQFERVEIEPHKTVFERGDKPTFLYVLESGDLSLVEDEKVDWRGNVAEARRDETTQQLARNELSVSGNEGNGGGSSCRRCVTKINLGTVSSASNASERRLQEDTAAGLLDHRRRIQRYRSGRMSDDGRVNGGGFFGGLDFFLGQRCVTCLSFVDRSFRRLSSIYRSCIVRILKILDGRRAFLAQTSAPCVVHRLSRERLIALHQDEPRLAGIVQHLYLKTLCLDVRHCLNERRNVRSIRL
jgi:hypothetical protein